MLPRHDQKPAKAVGTIGPKLRDRAYNARSYKSLVPVWSEHVGEYKSFRWKKL